MRQLSYYQGYADGVSAGIAFEKQTQAQKEGEAALTKFADQMVFEAALRGFSIPCHVPAGTWQVPIRETRNSLPDSSAERNGIPMADGLLDYFPNALAEVAKVSKIGNEQHNPGQPMHWAREKSTNHADKILRHLVDRGRKDSKGIRHSAYMAWRALALLQIELEKDTGVPPPRNAY